MGKISLEVKPQVSDFVLSGTLLNVGLSLKSVKALYRQDVSDLTKIEGALLSFLDSIKDTLSDVYLSKGVKLPIPNIMNVVGVSEQMALTAGNGYFVLEAEPKQKEKSSSFLQ